MCGIAGIVDFNGRAIDPALLYKMGCAIAHRGPDDEGYALIAPQEQKSLFFSGPESNRKAASTLPDVRGAVPQEKFSIGFAHRRFSIIDLSEAGRQPIAIEEGRWLIIYNGEVYNYRELRDELIAAGVSFLSQSDTEVVLQAYRRWGVKCFERMNGFWALAIFDPARRCVLLSRDRIGVKPLYYAAVDGRLFFASEIKALTAVPCIRQNASENGDAVRDWLRFGIKDHTAETFFSGIRAFPAGSWAYMTPDFPEKTTKFWSLPGRRLQVSEIPADRAADELRRLLTDAINLRLRADVPLAVSLSGGVDSSSIVALAKHELGVSLPAFTAGFAGTKAEENAFAASVAKSCGCEHIIIDPPADALWNDIDAFTWLAEEPYHSPILHTEQLVWARMRKEGVKVAFNGASGDEDFGGYGFHYSLMQIARLAKGDIAGYIREALLCADTPFRIVAFVKPIIYALRQSLVDPKYRVLDFDKKLHQDMTSTLMPYWLASGDRGYMGIPIELREPFLDYRIVEFAFSLPLDYLVRDGWQKWIVRKTVEPYLPKEIVWRRRKMGFAFPLSNLLRQNGAAINRLISSSRSPFVKNFPLSHFRRRWKMISYLLWYAWYIEEDRTVFDSFKNNNKALDMWPLVPEYFDSFARNHSAVKAAEQ